MPVEIEGSAEPQETRLGQDFTIHQGEYVELHVDLVDNPDISGKTIIWVLSESPNTPIIVKKTTADGPSEIEVTNQNSGKFIVKILPDDTRDLDTRYHHGSRMEPGDGTDEAVLFTGTVNILPSPSADA